MEIREKLRVTAEEFFSQMMVSVLYDIKSATGRDVKREQIHKGYHYTKKMKNKVGRTDIQRLLILPVGSIGLSTGWRRHRRVELRSFIWKTMREIPNLRI